jgi:hypothetical protein
MAVEDLVRAVWDAVIHDTPLRGSVPTVVARAFDGPDARVMFVGYAPIPIGIGWWAVRHAILQLAAAIQPQL